MPKILLRFGFTGYTVPPKGVLSRFQSTCLPTLPSRSEAPITATLFGLKMLSRGRRSDRNRSCAGSITSFEPERILPPGVFIIVSIYKNLAPVTDYDEP